MIQPISALTPKVFRSSDSKRDSALRTRKQVAVVHAAGTSTVAAAVATIMFRNITSWANAAVLGIMIGATLMMLLTRDFLRKAGKNTAPADTDSFTKIVSKRKPNVKQILRKAPYA